MGKNFKATTINEITRSIEEQRGLLKFNKITSYDFMWTYKYQEPDAVAMRVLLRKKYLIQDMKSTSEVDSSSKRFRLD